MSLSLSIIIPLYNEQKSIQLVLSRIKEQALNYPFEIVIVDDGSTDDSAAQVLSFKKMHPEMDIKLIHKTENQGKGAAIRNALEVINGEIILIQDADLEYHPKEYNTLLEPIFNAYADVVYGSRFISSKPHRVLFFGHALGNRFLTFLSNLFTGLNLSDMECGYKVFKASLIKDIQLKEKRFGFEPELTAKLAAIPHIRFYEIGISYFGRSYQEGKKIGFKDGFRAIYCIFKYGLKLG
jgi:glycosyltransferase involved in cell wall biosynthesis